MNGRLDGEGLLERRDALDLGQGGIAACLGLQDPLLALALLDPLEDRAKRADGGLGAAQRQALLRQLVLADALDLEQALRNLHLPLAQLERGLCLLEARLGLADVLLARARHQLGQLLLAQRERGIGRLQLGLEKIHAPRTNDGDRGLGRDEVAGRELVLRDDPFGLGTDDAVLDRNDVRQEGTLHDDLGDFANRRDVDARRRPLGPRRYCETGQ